MQSGLNSVSMAVGVMEKALYSSYTHYILTNRDVPRQVAFIENTIGLPEGMNRESMMHVAGVPEAAIGDFLDGLQETWGGPLAYLLSIGISKATMEAVREGFLELKSHTEG